MQFLTVAVVLAICSHGFAFQCDTTFSGRVCGKYAAASQSLQSAVKTVDGTIADMITDVSNDMGAVFQSVFPDLANLKITDQVIRLDNNTVIRITGNMTVDDVKRIMNRTLITLKTLNRIGLLSDKTYEKLVQKLEEAIKRILSTASLAYAGDDLKETAEKVKAAVREAIKHLNSFAQILIMKAVDRLQGHYNTITERIGNVMKTLGLESRWIPIKAKIDAALKKILDKATGTGINKVGTAIMAAEVDTLAMFEEINKQSPIVKRGITDWWTKVKEAVKDLGSKISKTTKEVIEKYRPKIEEALKNAKKIAIDGIVEIFVKVNGQIVQIVTQGAVGNSS